MPPPAPPPEVRGVPGLAGTMPAFATAVGFAYVAAWASAGLVPYAPPGSLSLGYAPGAAVELRLTSAGRAVTWPEFAATGDATLAATLWATMPTVQFNAPAPRSRPSSPPNTNDRRVRPRTAETGSLASGTVRPNASAAAARLHPNQRSSSPPTRTLFPPPLDPPAAQRSTPPLSSSRAPPAWASVGAHVHHHRTGLLCRVIEIDHSQHPGEAPGSRPVVVEPVNSPGREISTTLAALSQTAGAPPPTPHGTARQMTSPLAPPVHQHLSPFAQPPTSPPSDTHQIIAALHQDRALEASVGRVPMLTVPDLDREPFGLRTWSSRFTATLGVADPCQIPIDVALRRVDQAVLKRYQDELASRSLFSAAPVHLADLTAFLDGSRARRDDLMTLYESLIASISTFSTGKHTVDQFREKTNRLIELNRRAQVADQLPELLLMVVILQGSRSVKDARGPFSKLRPRATGETGADLRRQLMDRVPVPTLDGYATQLVQTLRDDQAFRAADTPIARAFATDSSAAAEPSNNTGSPTTTVYYLEEDALVEEDACAEAAAETAATLLFTTEGIFSVVPGKAPPCTSCAGSHHGKFPCKTPEALACQRAVEFNGARSKKQSGERREVRCTGKFCQTCSNFFGMSITSHDTAACSKPDRKPSDYKPGVVRRSSHRAQAGSVPPGAQRR